MADTPPATGGEAPLRVLHVEDSADDADLLLHSLRQAGYEPLYERVETAVAMERALAESPWDAVLSDYDLPHFSAPAALHILHASGLDIPFLIVSGAIGEEVAVAMMKEGAHDYIAKGNLSRLVPAIQREVGDARTRRERRELEEERAALLDLANAIGGRLELDEILEQVHGRIAALLECEPVLTYRWNPKHGAFQFVSGVGLSSELESAAATVAISGEMAAAWQQNRALVIVNDVTAQRWMPLEVLARFDCSAFLAAPLIVRGELTGALAAARLGQRGGFSPRQAQLFEGMSRHAALAIGAAELFRAQREEALVATAQARAGEELIGSLTTPRLLSRFCELTTEILSCERSATWLRNPEGSSYNAVAGHGHSPEQWEALQLTDMSCTALAGFLAHFEREATAELSAEESFGIPLALVDDQPNRVLLMALRRGDTVVAVHTATRLGARARFTALELRIATGLAQLASLALENSRLVGELERANRLKSDFLATMSHELRTPLHIIMGYTGLLHDGEFGALVPEQIRSLEIVQRSAEGLLELITATLDISRIERGQASVDVGEVHVGELLDELVDELRRVDAKPGLDLRCEPSAALPLIHTDTLKLKVIVKNLLSNALKFTDTGSVSASARAHLGGVEIAVADTGIGIAAATQSFIFEAFRQAEPATTRRYGGVGLGLYVVRRLLDLLGGTIAVDSEPGRGSTFRVWLPRSLPDNPRTAPPASTGLPK